MSRTRTCLLAAGVCLTSLVTARVAHAITCDAIPNANNSTSGTLPPVVYIEGANAVGPFIAPLQQALSVDPNPINVVYIGDGGCVGANNFFTGSSISTKPAPVYYAAQTQRTCTLPMTGPNNGPPVADIGTSDVYAPTCGTLPGGQLPPNVADFHGPIQPMVFVVPKASSQQSISAGAAYFVFGFGGDSGVAPWTSNGSIYRRNASSAEQAMLAAGIGVPLARWAGVDVGTLTENTAAGLSGAAAVINAIELDPNPENVIGILADTNLDATTTSHVATLAYKDFGQSCGYYPDSTAAAHDKANVRDGHYALWGPIHFFTSVNSSGMPLNPNVARLISYMMGTSVAPGGVDLTQVDAQNNLVAPCAMHVSRTTELGPLASFASPGSCSCYYDYVSTGQSSCTRCSSASACPVTSPVCNLSLPVAFCETQ